MVYTERAPRRPQFHVASAMYQPNSSVTTSVDIQNALCKLQSLIQSRLRLERRGREQRYSCHCEALRTHLEMRRPTSVHINKLINLGNRCQLWWCYGKISHLAYVQFLIVLSDSPGLRAVSDLVRFTWFTCSFWSSCQVHLAHVQFLIVLSVSPGLHAVSDRLVSFTWFTCSFWSSCQFHLVYMQFLIVLSGSPGLHAVSDRLVRFTMGVCSVQGSPHTEHLLAVGRWVSPKAECSWLIGNGRCRGLAGSDVELPCARCRLAWAWSSEPKWRKTKTDVVSLNPHSYVVLT